MEKGKQNGKTSGPTFLTNVATSSRLLHSFQEMIHPRPVNANVPFVDRRVLIQDIPKRNDAERVRQICSELLSSLSAKEKLFQVGSQHRTCEGKSWALAYEGGNYGGQREDKKLILPFLVHTKYAENYPFLGDCSSKEIPNQAVPNQDNKEYKIESTVVQQHKNRDKLSHEPAEKKRKEDALEDKNTSNGPKERETYWERRKKNNASAKKSRDARKARELQTQIKAAFLEREILRIHAQLMIVQQENACLKRVLCAKM